MNPLLDATAVAGVLGVSKQRVYALSRLGLLRAVRLGRQIRFAPEALAEFIRDGGANLPPS